MKHVTYNLFKHEKKLKQLERKRQRNDKRKALIFYSNIENSK